MKEKVDTIAKNESGPPKKPEDYDILDESIDDSSSAKWRAEYDSWLISQGQQAAKKSLSHIELNEKLQKDKHKKY